MRNYLEAAAHLSVVVATVVALVVVSHAWHGSAAPAASASSDLRSPVGYRLGENAPSFANLSYNGAPRTVLLFVKSSCVFCTDSMSFYRELGQSAGHRAGQYRIVAASIESESDTRVYLRSHGVEVDQIVSFSLQDNVKVPVTPTLMVVNSRGTVEHMWVGFQRQDGQRKIVSSL